MTRERIFSRRLNFYISSCTSPGKAGRSIFVSTDDFTPDRFETYPWDGARKYVQNFEGRFELDCVQIHSVLSYTTALPKYISWVEYSSLSAALQKRAKVIDYSSKLGVAIWLFDNTTLSIDAIAFLSGCRLETVMKVKDNFFFDSPIDPKDLGIDFSWEINSFTD